MFKLESSAFKNGEIIPTIYTSTKKGKNISPPLKWSGTPEETKSLVIVAEDPALPFYSFPHWVLFNIPPDFNEIPEDIPGEKIFKNGMIQAKNGYGRNEYLGPNPFWGTHCYHFKLYAIKTILNPDYKLNRDKVLKLIKKHVIAESEIVGYYSKK